ncbi:MAG: glucose-1-phosphate cytidylyltransferase [Rhizobiales bacterium]|nr:glucose-1-phosphate cytidylyltransferase [Hyphomicrobiales bacterium]
MKVVLFCGGFGMRMREYSESIPKPMVTIGNRPILWHIMKYYAHFGHKDFILCLGWKANAIKQYFLQYDECTSNDFVLTSGGRSVELLNSDIHDWKITFVDTGTRANIGQRLKAVEPHLAGEETFLANYTDGLSDLHLPDMIDTFRDSDSIASFLSVKPSQSFHAVQAFEDGTVSTIEPVAKTGMLMNGGFFAFRRGIFDVMKEGEELVEEPFQRLIQNGQLSTYAYDGFWSCMDTFKEKQALDDLYASGAPPWAVWEIERRAGTVRKNNGAPPARSALGEELAPRRLDGHDLATS